MMSHLRLPRIVPRQGAGQVPLPSGQRQPSRYYFVSSVCVLESMFLCCFIFELPNYKVGYGTEQYAFPIGAGSNIPYISNIQRGANLKYREEL